MAKKNKKKSCKHTEYYKGFEISSCRDGLRVTRLDVPGDKHTHLKTINACRSVIDNVLDEKLPYSKCKWYLRSLIRLSTNEEYVKKIEALLETRERKGIKPNYINR